MRPLGREFCSPSDLSHGEHIPEVGMSPWLPGPISLKDRGMAGVKPEKFTKMQAPGHDASSPGLLVLSMGLLRQFIPIGPP